MKVVIIAKCHNNHQNGLLIYREAKRQEKDVYLACAGWGADQIIALVRFTNADVTMVTGKATLPGGVLQRIKTYSRLAIWDADGIDRKRDEQWRALAGVPDIVFTSVAGLAERYADIHNIHWTPQYWDSEHYKPTMPRLSDYRPKYDVCFIGNSSSSHRRVAWCQQLKSRYLMALYGNIAHLSKREIYGSDMADVYRQSKIVIDIQRENIIPMTCGTSDRIFKAMGVGAFYLTYPINDIGRLFEPRKHFDMYDNTLSGLIEKIDYWLNHEDQREAIAVAGQVEIEKYHTLKVRINQYWNLMEGML